MQAHTPLDGSVHGTGSPLAQLSDAELLAGTRRLVGRSNQILAELLVHLGEVEARGIHRTRACSILYAYCIYELRFSEDEAFRRVAAARLIRRFPALLDALACGELHLTGLLMLGPHLTETNLVEILARAKHRTKRELAKLVRVLDALPAVPARIEPLGPAPARLVPPEPTWQAFIDSTCLVRELAPGERPREWTEGANDSSPSSRHLRRRVRHIPAPVRRTVFERDGNRCSYLDASGARCPETHRLEFHHLKPFAAHHASNLTLRCAAHNALAAEEDFGHELIDETKTSRRHESFGSFRG